MLKNLQDSLNYTELLVMQEEMKFMPYGDVWAEYLKRQNIPNSEWFNEVKKYEKEVLSLRK